MFKLKKERKWGKGLKEQKEKKNPEENSDKTLVTYKKHRPMGINSHKDKQE